MPLRPERNTVKFNTPAAMPSGVPVPPTKETSQESPRPSGPIQRPGRSKLWTHIESCRLGHFAAVTLGFSAVFSDPRPSYYPSRPSSRRSMRWFNSPKRAFICSIAAANRFSAEASAAVLVSANVLTIAMSAAIAAR